jgi:hypothetical protein
MLLDERQLPEEVARAKLADRADGSVATLHVGAPGEDDVQGRGRRPLLDDRLAGRIGAVLALLGQPLDGLPVEARQQRGRGEGGFDIHDAMVASGRAAGKGPRAGDPDGISAR